jgi:hypothetical protein
MFAWNLQKKWSLCLPATSITHQGCACTLLGPNVWQYTGTVKAGKCLYSERGPPSVQTFGKLF